MAKITTLTGTRNELRSSCSPTVNRLLFNFVGAETLNSCTEQQLLQHIKSVAVKRIHKEVHRQHFHSLQQSEGESVTHYLAKLWSQASLCDFRVKCSNESCQAQVSFSKEMISGQLITGLANMDHQGKVLAEADSLTSLQVKFNKLVSLETTDQATCRLHIPLPASVLKGSSKTATQKTPYTQLKNSRKLALSQKNGQGAPVCKGCGETVHPPGKSIARKDCPAFSLTCRNCGIKGHLEKVCRQASIARSTLHHMQPIAYHSPWRRCQSPSLQSLLHPQQWAQQISGWMFLIFCYKTKPRITEGPPQAPS